MFSVFSPGGQKPKAKPRNELARLREKAAKRKLDAGTARVVGRRGRGTLLQPVGVYVRAASRGMTVEEDSFLFLQIGHGRQGVVPA